jgi:16S rRNA G966 N2-methylase RsmD
VAVDRNASWRALADSRRRAGNACARDASCGRDDVLTREPRRFDVIFLDPPFDLDLWGALLPAAASRLAPDGLIYAEARSTVAATDGLGIARSDRAGQVHYHLLRKIEATEQPAC